MWIEKKKGPTVSSQEKGKPANDTAKSWSGGRRKTRWAWGFRSLGNKVSAEGKRVKSTERRNELRTEACPLHLPRQGSSVNQWPWPRCSFQGAWLPTSGFPGGSDKKESACNAGDLGSIPRSGRALGGHGSPRQYPFLKNPKDRRAWWATVHGDAKSQTWLSN